VRPPQNQKCIILTILLFVGAENTDTIVSSLRLMRSRPRLLMLWHHRHHLLIVIASPQATLRMPLRLLATGLRIEKLHICFLFSLLGYRDVLI
jgi:hypothetical protein